MECLPARESLVGQEEAVGLDMERTTEAALTDAAMRTFGETRCHILTLQMQHAYYLPSDVFELYIDMSERITQCLPRI